MKNFIYAFIAAVLLSGCATKFQWPTKGNMIYGYDGLKSKGIGIDGESGDPIYASAAGKVVYAGSGLRGYGNLIILKHDDEYLTAYAHLKLISVEEKQAVNKGQKIGEMGNSESDKVKLHFEIRQKGIAVDPIKYLPNN